MISESLNQIKKRSKSIPELIKYTKSKLMSKLIFKDDKEENDQDQLSSSKKRISIDESSKKHQANDNCRQTMQCDQMAIGNKENSITTDFKLFNKAKTILVKSRSKVNNNENKPMSSQNLNLNHLTAQRRQSVPLVNKRDGSFCFCNYFY